MQLLIGRHSIKVISRPTARLANSMSHPRIWHVPPLQQALYPLHSSLCSDACSWVTVDVQTSVLYESRTCCACALATSQRPETRQYRQTPRHRVSSPGRVIPQSTLLVRWQSCRSVASMPRLRSRWPSCTTTCQRVTSVATSSMTCGRCVLEHTLTSVCVNRSISQAQQCRSNRRVMAVDDGVFMLPCRPAKTWTPMNMTANGLLAKVRFAHNARQAQLISYGCAPNLEPCAHVDGCCSYHQVGRGLARTFTPRQQHGQQWPLHQLSRAHA